MALLNILQYPDERLHTVAKPVEKIDERIQTLVADMFETMYEARGIGLAATQVNVHERIVVMDLTEDRSEPRVFINPVIVEKDGETTYEEGCLSVPGIYDTVTRAERVKVEALNEKGEKFTLEADGLLAICVQHELDHLMGIVFVEHLSQLKQAASNQTEKTSETHHLTCASLKGRLKRQNRRQTSVFNLSDGLFS